MKIKVLPFVSHALVAISILVTAALMAALGFSSLLQWVAMICVGAVVATGASLFVKSKISRGLETLTTLTGHFDLETKPESGLIEFDAIAGELFVKFSSRDDIEVSFGELSRDVEAIRNLLSTRGQDDQPATSQIRQILGSIGNTLQNSMAQVQQSVLEIGRCTQEIVEGSESQDHVSEKTDEHIDQLMKSIDIARKESNAVHLQLASTIKSVDDAMQVVQELTQGFGRIRTSSETSKRQLRSLSDPTRQISSIADTISDVAARTDLLALNASIESIRAGEHGRGFAVVADEVRKLAEQTSQAAHEIETLTDTLRKQTEDSIGLIDREQGQIEREAGLIAGVEDCLQKIVDSTSDNASRIQHISTEGAQQLQVAQSILTTVEKFTDASKADRTRADHACWTMKSLAKTTLEMNSSIKRLCGFSNAPPEKNESLNASISESLENMAPADAIASAFSGMSDDSSTMAGY